MSQSTRAIPEASCQHKSEIVGINNFKASSFEGLGFAITSNNVNDISAGLISTYEQNNP